MALPAALGPTAHCGKHVTTCDLDHRMTTPTNANRTRDQRQESPQPTTHRNQSNPIKTHRPPHPPVTPQTPTTHDTYGHDRGPAMAAPATIPGPRSPPTSPN